jgi:DNA-binding GntR family transcriptional regulator
MIHNISLADQVFEQLENDILTGKYQYGEIITEAKLSQDLGVSRTPIREALRRLEQEGIIADSGKGMKVLGITIQDISDIYEIRLRLEGVAASWAAKHATEENIAELAGILDLQEFYAERGDSEHIRDMDTKFHESLYTFSGSPILKNTLMPLHKRVMKYRKASLEKTGRALHSTQEHRAIYEAIKARNAEQAEKLTTAHVFAARKSVLGE